MLGKNGAMDGIDTRPYQGRQTAVQAIEEAVRQKAAILTRTYKRDARLITAVVSLTSLLTLSVVDNVYQGRTGVRTEPYVVMVDHLGNEQPVLRVAEVTVSPQQAQVIGVLMAWVENVRSMSNDAIVFGKNWERADDYTSNAGIAQLQDFRREQKERQEAGTRVEVSRLSVLPIGSSTRSYVVEWEEKAYDEIGRLKVGESGRWKATLTIADFQSKAAKQERDLRQRQKRSYRNLLGIIVDSVNWSGRPLLSQIQPPIEGQ